MIRDQTQAKIEANKDALADLFRRAVRAKCEQWHAERAIERLLGVELDLADSIDAFAAGVANAEDASTIDDDEMLNAIIENVINEGEHE